MLDFLFDSVIETEITASGFFGCTAVSVLLGLAIAGCCMYKNRTSKSMVVSLALIPVIVQVVIMMVNGNLGAGLAVAGAFSLIRFRSAPGTARDIVNVFASMACGLATGMGYLGVAAIFAAVFIALNLIYNKLRLGNSAGTSRRLRVVIPESLNYNGAFDDLFDKYTVKHELNGVKTTNMGSMYKLTYDIVLSDITLEKELIDGIRCRNGNLEISCAYEPDGTGEL